MIRSINVTQLTRRRFFTQSIRFITAGLMVPHMIEPRLVASAKSSSEQDHGWQIGCYTRPWAQYDYRVALDAIVEAGFKSVGLMTCQSKTGVVISVDTTLEEAHEVGNEVQARGLRIPSVYGGGFTLDTLQEAIGSLQTLIDNSAAAGGKSLLLAGNSTPSLDMRYYKTIAECADYAAEKKVQLVLKPHGGSNATGPQCRRIVQNLGHDNFRLWYDPGNTFYYSEGKVDPADDAATVNGIVTGICIKDYLHPKNVMVTPGDGEVDFPAVFAHLKAGGFTHGPLIIETLTPGDPPALFKEAIKARQFVEQLVDES